MEGRYLVGTQALDYPEMGRDAKQVIVDLSEQGARVTAAILEENTSAAEARRLGLYGTPRSHILRRGSVAFARAEKQRI